MPEHPTPGETAYMAYRHRMQRGPRALVPWELLARRTRHAWEAAAQAVLATAQPRLVRVEDPHLVPLRALVEEARPFLEAAFGAVLRDIIVHVQDDASAGDHLMRVVARVASNDTAYLDGLLRYFDESWWLANCHRSGGRLVFAYETHPRPPGEGTAP